MLRSRTAWLAREHGEAPQRFAIGRKNRRGPTRAQPVRQGQIAIIVSQRICGDVADNDRLSEVGSPAARTRGRADGSAAKSSDVAGRKAGSRAMPKPVVIRTQH